jgi:hypothetical protein
MRRLFLPLLTLVMAAGIACTAGTPSPSTMPGPPGNDSLPSPASTAGGQSPAPETPDGFFLLVSHPQDESVVDRSPLEVHGITVVEGVVTVNGQVVDVGPQGQFTSSVILEEGPNIIEVVASDFDGNEEALALAVIYIP